MKSLISTTILLIFMHFSCHGATYTFHTYGDFSDINNWDIFPGTHLLNGDTISIEANCYNVDIFVTEGFVIVAEDVNSVGITNLYLNQDSSIEFLHSSNLQIDISGYVTLESSNQMIFPDYSNIFIINHGYGIDFNGLYDMPYFINYLNFGTQNSFFLEGMMGTFNNEGTIEVYSSIFQLEADLNLSYGTIQGMMPFILEVANGSISQPCANCESVINNITHLYLYENLGINGKLTLNTPD